MEIELSPHLWFKSLNPGIKGCRDGYQKHKSKRIRRINIIEMHYLGIAMKYLSYQISQCDDYNDHQENEQVDIAESHDEFRDRIIRYYLRKQSRFPTPSKPVIFSGKLHPYRVYAVLWHHTDISHNQKLVLFDRE